MSLRTKILLLLIIMVVAGCGVTPVKDEDKTHWPDREFQTGTWIQFMEFEITHRSKRIEDL